MTSKIVKQILTTEHWGVGFIKIWTKSSHADLYVNKINLICLFRVNVLYRSHRFPSMTRGTKKTRKQCRHVEGWLGNAEQTRQSAL